MKAVMNMGGEAKLLSEFSPPELKWRYRRQLVEQYRLRLAGAVQPQSRRRRDATDTEAQQIELAEAYELLHGEPPYFAPKDDELQLELIEKHELAFPDETFGQVSESGKAFIRGLLEPSVTKR